MKLKGFTLVEILIASTIFTIVIMTAVSSFALIRRSNYKSEDNKIAASCARQIEDFIKAEVISSSTSPRIELIKQSSNNRNKYDIFSVPGFDDYPVLGLALFQGGQVKLIFKDPSRSANGHIYRYRSMPLADYTDHVKPGVNINSALVNGSSPLFSEECRTKDEAETFRVKFREKYPVQTVTPTSDTSDDIYEVQMEDTVFRFIIGADAGNLSEQWAQAQSKGTVSRINLDVTNSINRI